MKIAILVLGIIETIICVICFFFKKKQNFLICLEVYNLLLLTQYIIQGYLTECIIVGVDIVKVLVFFLFDIKNKKPQIWVIIIFEIAMIAIGIFTFSNWFSIFLIVSSMISTFAAWQPNMFVLRLSYIICSLLVITNYVFTGLYTTIIAESISLLSSLISIIKYYVIDPKIKLKKEASAQVKENIEQSSFSASQDEQTSSESKNQIPESENSKLDDVPVPNDEAKNE